MPNLMSFHKPFLTLDDLPVSVGLNNWTIFPYIDPIMILGVPHISQSQSFYLQSYFSFHDSTINNEAHWTNFFHKGTYSLKILHAKSETSGILSIKMDDLVLGTPDWYSEGWSLFEKTIYSDLKLSKSNHTLKMKITDKNASSVAYNMYVSCFTFRRTA